MDDTTTSTGRSSTANLIFFAMLAGVLILYLYFLRPMGHGSQGRLHGAIGSKLTYLSLVSLADDKPLELPDLAGKVVLINFWATWCGPCQSELPHIVDFQKKFGSRDDFQLLAITCPGEGESDADLRAATRSYLEQRNYNLPTYVDPQQASYRAIVLGTGSRGGIPMTLVLDRASVIRGIWEGYGPGSEVEMGRLLEELRREEIK